MFRYKKSVPVSYERQGYIYFSSLLYREMPEKAQRKILNLCMECGGGDYYRALFEFVTTDANATYICMKHSLSRSTLERIVRKYYEGFPRRLCQGFGPVCAAAERARRRTEGRTHIK
mgnify:CR=1 FL=1